MMPGSFSSVSLSPAPNGWQMARGGPGTAADTHMVHFHVGARPFEVTSGRCGAAEERAARRELGEGVKETVLTGCRFLDGALSEGCPAPSWVYAARSMHVCVFFRAHLQMSPQQAKNSLTHTQIQRVCACVSSCEGLQL